MRAQRISGYSLVELLLVIAMLALIAAVASPGFSSNDELKLNRAATEVASAVRFARSEAIRTGEGHGLTVSQATQQVTVKKYDIEIAPIVTLNTLTHPISKQPYNFNVNTDKSTRGVTISNSSDVFDYGSAGRRRSLIFDANGTPVWIVGSSPDRHLLVDAAVELSYEGQTRYVRVSPMTGRGDNPVNRRPLSFRQAGLTYVEVMIATVLIAVALVPAIDALYTGMRGAGVYQSASTEHYAALALMEEVMAEQLSSLRSAAAVAGDKSVPTSYSDASGTPERRLVYIALYDADNGDGDGDAFTVPDPNLDGDNDPYTGYTGLIWVRVEVEGSITPLESLSAP